jgi:8-hydroxy-5-deazaflavin:NADPH oxidoreductase
VCTEQRSTTNVAFWLAEIEGTDMRVGILGGTGPAGQGMATRLAAGGSSVTLGSRDAGRAADVAAQVVAKWPDRGLSIDGSDNAAAAGADIVIVATPWDSTPGTVRELADALAGKVVISMANALVKNGRDMVALIPGRGSIAAAVQAAAPAAKVTAAFHHLPAAVLADLDGPLEADVLVCSDHPEATETTLALTRSIEGLRAFDAGSLAQAGPIEAFTAVCITLNIRHRAHSSLRLSGI